MKTNPHRTIFQVGWFLLSYQHMSSETSCRYILHSRITPDHLLNVSLKEFTASDSIMIKCSPCQVPAKSPVGRAGLWIEALSPAIKETQYMRKWGEIPAKSPGKPRVGCVCVYVGGISIDWCVRTGMLKSLVNSRKNLNIFRLKYITWKQFATVFENISKMEHRFC